MSNLRLSSTIILGSWSYQVLGSILLEENGFFCIKRNLDGSIDRFKARLVAQCFHERLGIDFHDNL